MTSLSGIALDSTAYHRTVISAHTVGRFARDALAQGEGICRAVLRRSFYLEFAGGRFACVGDEAIGRGPLNALVSDFAVPRLGDRIALSAAGAQLWTPPPASGAPDVDRLRREAAKRIPREGLACLIVGAHNALSGHLQPALDALAHWLVGHALSNEIQALIGAGPGITPAGDDYLGGVLLALHHLDRKPQAASLWRWLEPRLGRTSALSAAYLAASAEGEGHEALHNVLNGSTDLERLDDWDSLAGIVAVVGLP
jgi:hypothetical protein